MPAVSLARALCRSHLHSSAWLSNPEFPEDPSTKTSLVVTPCIGVHAISIPVLNEELPVALAPRVDGPFKAKDELTDRFKAHFNGCYLIRNQGSLGLSVLL